MSLGRLMAARLRGLLRRGAVERDMDEEMRFHVEMEAEANVRRGMTEGEARRRALKSFGDVVRVKEAARDVRGGGLIETVWQDLRYGVRSMRKNPGFTLVAVVTLALGVGANTAIFSVVNAVLLRPLPFGSPDRLVGLRESLPDEPSIPVAYRTYAAWRDSLGDVFESVAAASIWDLTVESGGEAERVPGARVTAAYFDVMRVRPLAGRGFVPGDDRPESPRVAVIDEALWHARFGGSPRAVGRTLRIEGDDYEIVGVMPTIAERSQTGWASVWVPLTVRSAARQSANPFRYLTVIARLRPGVSVGQAREESARVMRALRQDFPDTHGKPYGVDVRPLRDFVVPYRAQAALLFLLGAVGLVLLIACANVASLLLARATTRGREMAVRTALGASRRRVVRQLLTESLLLACAGALAGLALARVGLKLLVAAAPGSIPRLDGARMSPAVFGFALAAALLSSMVAGLVPALTATKVDLASCLKDAARGAGRSPRQRTLRDLLVVGELALALPLLIAAGLLARSYARLSDAPAGFDTEHSLTMEVKLPASGYDTRERRTAFFREAVRRASALPGVEVAGAAQSLPLRGPLLTDPVIVEGTEEPPPGQVPFVRENIVTPDYFRAMGMSLVKGRTFSERETWETGGAIIVNEAFARRFFAGEEPLGRRVKLGAGKPWMEVVGVVGDTLDDGFDARPVEQMFYPYTNPSDELPLSFLTLVMRTRGDPAALAAAARGEIAQIDRAAPVSRVMTARQLAARSTSAARFNVLLAGLFAAIAFVLAAAGVYGLTSYAVAQRTREIGVRMALGARPSDIMRLVVGRAVLLTLAGIVIGVMAALGLSRFMGSMLFGVSAADPATYASVTLGLLTVAAAAGYIPARRATKVDPLIALRAE